MIYMRLSNNEVIKYVKQINKTRDFSAALKLSLPQQRQIYAALPGGMRRIFSITGRDGEYRYEK